jgi:hypothetical protein
MIFNPKFMAIQAMLSTSKLLQIIYSLFCKNFIIFRASSYLFGFISYSASLEINYLIIKI